MDKIDKIISIVRYLREEAMASSAMPPTNHADSSGLGFDPQKESPPAFRKRYAYLGKNSRSRWMKRR